AAVKRIPGRKALTALVVGGILLASVALIGAGSASVPQSGVNCALDGKISGRGATFQTRAQTAFANGFRDDVCGKVTDPNGDNMVIYNYDATTGSGAGQRGASCRTDAFSGSDIPYDTATLAQLNSAPGSITGGCAAFGAFTGPYQPTPGPYPNAA